MKKLLFILLAVMLLSIGVSAQTDVIKPEVSINASWGAFFAEGYHPQYLYSLDLSLPFLTEWIGFNKFTTSVKTTDGQADTTRYYTFLLTPEVYAFKSKFSYADSNKFEAVYSGLSLRKTTGLGSLYFSLGGGYWNMIDAAGADDITKLGFNGGLGGEVAGVTGKLSGHVIYLADTPDIYSITASIGYTFF